jgi:NCS1 family nucleobase:cation symporter-1
VYRDSLTKVEPYGIELIPEHERHGRTRDQFTVYFAINVALATLVTGFFPVLAGLSLWGALSSIVVGAAAGGLVLGLMSSMGSRLGVTQPVLARGVLGRFGIVPVMAYAGVFGMVGWGTINLVLAGWSLQAVIGGFPFVIAILLVAIGQCVVASYGYNWVHLMNRISTFVMGAVFLVVTIYALKKADFSFGANAKAPLYVGGFGGWITSAGVFLALLIGFSPFSADYSRYLPSSTSPVRVATLTGLGNFCAVAWLACTGAVVASAAGSYSEIDAVKHLTGGTAPVILLAIAASTIALNGFNMYGGSLTLLALGVRIPRTVAVMLLTVITFALALLLTNDLNGIFYDFLVLSGYLLAPFVAVTLLD